MAEEWIAKWIPDERNQRWIFAVIIAVIFIGFYVIHKSVLSFLNAIVVFLLFNLWKKNPTAQKTFSFFGEHSTNIWLTHMFFYLYLFPGLVQKLQLPLLMLAGLLVLSLI